MNSVYTGWVTDEDAAEIAARRVAEHRFHPPLDIVYGAARILDPIIAGMNSGEHVWGQFLKAFRPTDWEALAQPNWLAGPRLFAPRRDVILVLHE
jgi:hypothetical protein